MRKRRPCPVCRSRQWHKEPSSGLIACSEGHVLQNYRNETNETTDIGPHALHKRTIKSQRTVHTTTSRADHRLYHGARARYFYFECLQLLLRMQVAALVAAWSLPPEFEIVCRDLWALHLSLLPRPPPPEPYLHARDQGSDGAGGSSSRGAGAGVPIGGSLESELESERESHSGGSESDNDHEHERGDYDPAAAERDTLLADLLREASHSGSDAEDQEDDDDQHEAEDVEGSGGHRRPKGTAPLERVHGRYQVPAANIAVLVLACWTMRLPIMYVDIIRLIEAYTLPYLDPVRLLPSEMTRHLAKETVLALSPHFAPSVFSLHALTSRLARLCWSTYNVQIPEANIAPLLWRTIRALCGTSSLYTLTKAIAHVLSLPLTLHPALAPALVQSRRTDPRHYKSDNIPPELALVAAATVVLKLVYGLDGTERRPLDPTDPACALPCLEDYLARLRQRHAAPAPELFSAKSRVAAMDLDDAQLDEYLGFCERALLGNDVPDKAVAELFPLRVRERDDHRRERDAPPVPLLPPMRPSVLAMGSDVIQPGSVLRVYNTLDVLGTLPEAYGTVLEAGARIVGVEVDDVARVVERFERRLVRWAERNRKQ